jgi:magnesium-transporting ATPase (P-type)
MWHALPLPEVFTRLRSSPEGLSCPEADERLRRYGPNHFRRMPPASARRVLLAPFRSVIVLLLAAAAGIRTVMLTGDQQRTAESVGAALGLPFAGQRALDGRAVDRLTDQRRKPRSVLCSAGSNSDAGRDRSKAFSADLHGSFTTGR